MPVKGLDECEAPTRNDIKAALHEAGGWPDDIKTTVNNPYTYPSTNAASKFYDIHGIMDVFGGFKFAAFSA